MKIFNRAGFFLVLFCFLLPFARLSCSGDTIKDLNGKQLALGFKVDKSKVTYHSNNVRVALFAAVVGLGLSFVAFPSFVGQIVSVVASVVGLLFLFFFQSETENALGEYSGIASFDLRFGYWLAFVLFFVVVAVNGFLVFEGLKANHFTKMMRK